MLYGSDFYVSHLRGRSWQSRARLSGYTKRLSGRNTQIKPILIGLEHLRSLKWACWSETTDSQVEDIFWNNAAELFGLE